MGFTEENHRVTERTEDERRENYYPGSNFWAFRVDGIEIRRYRVSVNSASPHEKLLKHTGFSCFGHDPCLRIMALCG
jgi:hypothetical protein